MAENAVRAAMGMPIVGVEQKPYNGYWAEVILHSDKPGVFKKLWIDESIKSCIAEQDVWIKPGMKVGGFSAANEAIGTLVLKFNNQERLNEVMLDIQNYTKLLLED